MLLQDIWTVFWRDWIVLQRRLKKFIFSRMVAPLLYMVAFGWGLGRSIQPLVSRSCDKETSFGPLVLGAAICQHFY